MRVLDFYRGLTRADAVSSGDAPRAPLRPRAPGGACLSGAQRRSSGARFQPTAQRTRSRRGTRCFLCSAPLRVPSSVAGLNLGGARPGFRSCRDRPIPIPPQQRTRRRSLQGVPTRVPPPAEAPESLRPLPQFTMGPGSRLLLPLVLCVGLGALVPSAKASGVRKRGPSVTAKVTEWRAATLPL